MKGLRLTEAQLNKLQADGKIRGWKDTSPKPKEKKPDKVPMPVKIPEGLLYIMRQLEAQKIPYVTEHRFHPVRRFRFDIAIPSKMIAIEYEGLVSTGRKGGHQTKAHYTKDCEKYNEAQKLGWRVYRYTAYNYKDFDIKTII